MVAARPALLARGDRLAAFVSLVGVTGLAWLYLLHEASRMDAMGAMTMANRAPWDPLALGATFLMWVIMMVGMMLPSAAPSLLLYGTLARRNAERGVLLASIWVFAIGYLAVWTGFSLLAACLQAALQDWSLLSGSMVSTSGFLSGALLVAAGVYQWLPFKSACLRHCRNPLQFLLGRWRPGRLGALRMGAAQGAYCLGCCWLLMALLFAVGVMDLPWVAAIAAFVFAEKLLPAPRITSRVAGALLTTAGLYVIAV